MSAFGRTWRYGILAGCGALGLFGGVLRGQSPSTLTVIRGQLGEIANESCDSLNLAPASTVALSVDATKDANLAENAFLDAFHKKGLVAWLRRDSDSATVVVTVSVLTDEVKFEQVAGDRFSRTVETGAEVRADFRAARQARVLGILRRMSRDTVAQKDPGVPLTREGGGSDAEASFFQRLVGPLVVLASGILIVYLFFTVRS